MAPEVSHIEIRQSPDATVTRADPQRNQAVSYAVTRAYPQRLKEPTNHTHTHSHMHTHIHTHTNRHRHRHRHIDTATETDKHEQREQRCTEPRCTRFKMQLNLVEQAASAEPCARSISSPHTPTTTNLLILLHEKHLVLLIHLQASISPPTATKHV
jgi:hypothetical protein